MITYFKKTLSDTKVLEIEKAETGAWVNLIKPTEEELDSVSKDLEIDKDLLKSALDTDEKPRIEQENGTLLIIIKVPYVNGEITDTLPVGIIITSKNIITVSAEQNVVINDFLNMKVKSFFTTKKTRFGLQILTRTNYHYQRFLTEIEKKIESIEASVSKSFKNEEIFQLLGIQKSLIYINTAIVSNEKVLEKILNGKVLKMYDEDEDLLEDIIIDNKQAIDMVNIYSTILSNTMNAYASLISNNLNMVMKFLASVTIILAIPTIVASFYGMNIELPFEHSPNAFLIVVALTAVLSVTATIVFMRKNYF